MQRTRETRTNYLPEFGRVVRTIEIDRPMQSDDIETAQTIALMDELAARDSNAASVAAAVAEALDQHGVTADDDPTDVIAAVFWWLKRNVEYVAVPGTSPLVDQTLIAPTALLAMPEAIGDCGQFSMLASAMFRVLCMDCKFVTIAAEPTAPDQWSHVYCTVEVTPGLYMPFDSSNGPEPGAEYSRYTRRKVWERITPGKCRTKETAPEMVRSFQKTGESMRNRNLRSALHGNGDYGGETNDPADPYDYGVDYGGGGGSGWLSQLINAGTQIAVPLINRQTQQQPYFVTSPTGQSVLYNPNTGAVSGTAANPLSTISPTVLLVGIGAVALIALTSRK